MSSKLKGWIGEKKSALHLWFLLSTSTYHRFNNIILQSKSGTTQIDHLLISVYGVFIVETKNSKGWIYGSPDQPNWTLTYFQAKHSFQNPLLQTYRQKRVLMEVFGLKDQEVKTVVNFVGDCVFKTPMPENVLKSGLARHIKSFKEELFTQYEVDALINSVDNHISRNPLTSRDHLKSLKNRRDSNIFCPRCGSALVPRTVKKGPNAGNEFLGCGSYPKCRFTKNIP